MTCSTCKFWATEQPGGMKNRIGTCRRFPPVIVANVYTEPANENRGRYQDEVCTSTDSDWPTSLGHHWCGEHKPLSP